MPKREQRTSADSAQPAQSTRPQTLKTVTLECVHMTTANDLLANHWQLAVLLPPGMNRPGVGPGLSCCLGVEPPAGIEPATPSFPWNPRNRCADRRYRRSRSTVGARVMGSPSA